MKVAISTSEMGNSDLAVLIGYDGGMRMLDGSGWAPSGLLAEYGARQVYKVERRGTMIRVAGQSASQSCLLQQNISSPRRNPLYAVPRIMPSNRTPHLLP
jgi:hypothetical protein